MTTIECFNHVARCNNEGVALLLAGQDQQAAGAWTLALETAKSQLFRSRTSSAIANHQEQQRHHGYAATPTGTSKLIVYSSSSIPSSCSVSSSSSSSSSASSSSDDIIEDNMAPLINATFASIPHLASADFFIFNNTVVISSVTSLPRVEAAAPVYMASVILNLALVYHRQALLGGKPICMQKAEKMYDMVTKLINDNTLRDGTAMVVKCAALNNLALIRHERGDSTRAREGLQYLSYLLQSDKISSRRYILEATLNGFLLNIFLLVNLSRIAPAA